MIEIKTIPPFERALKRLQKRYKSIATDYLALLEELKQNPFAGTDLGKGVRKVRMAISAKGKGKSHGARVITYTDALVRVEEGTLILFYIYDKADKESISENEIRDLLEYIK